MIEGLITFLVGVIAVFTLQETPAKTKGWLTVEDKRFLELRAKFIYGGGALKTKNEFAWPDVIKALKVSMSWIFTADKLNVQSIHTWVISLIAICNTMALYGFSLSLPTIVKNMGFTAADAQGLSAPPYIFASICVVASGFFSDRYRLRACTIAFPSLFAFM